MKTKQSGFTLVEIAIVLVIIGLLLGGILKGQEMISQAKIKNIINDFNGITAAMNSYQDRYRALPGDENNTATVARWGAAAFGGDGNGVFCTGACPATTAALAAGQAYNTSAAVPASAGPEVNLFWWHLRLSGFVAGPTSGVAAGIQPNNAVNGMMGVQTGDGTAASLLFGSLIICTSNLPDKIAIAVDTQMDDGAPNTGQVRGQSQTAPNPTLIGAATGYQETGTNQYTLCKTL